VPVPAPEPVPVPGPFPIGGLGFDLRQDPWGRIYSPSLDPTNLYPLQPPPSPRPPAPPANWPSPAYGPVGSPDASPGPSPAPAPMAGRGKCKRQNVTCTLSGEFKDPSLDPRFKMCSYSCSDGTARVTVIHIFLPCPKTWTPD
jgi:hypothetical protein